MINRIIKILIGADLMFNSAAGFITPVFAIFLVRTIENGSAQLAGTAMAIYWLTKSALRIPVGYFLDKKKGENDDFRSMVMGFSIYTICYFLYLFAKTPGHIYAIQTLMGIGGAFAYTSWYGFFSRHIDKNHESFEWSVAISHIGFGIAAAGFIAGIVVEKFGFAPIFIISSAVSFSGVLLLLLIRKHIRVERHPHHGHIIKLKTLH